MFATMNLGRRLFAQVLLAVLPLVLMLGYRLWNDSRPADRFAQTVQTYELALETLGKYKQFVQGVSDAVDTGRVASSAIESLGVVASTDADAKKLFDVVRKDPNIGALLPQKDLVRSIEVRQARAVREAQAALKALTEEMASNSRRSAWQMGIALLFSLALVGWIIARLFKDISQPLSGAIHFADEISRGDLTREIEVEGVGEIGDLLRALQRMTQGLRGLIRAGATGANDIRHSIHELDAGNQNLSRRTQTQAASVEATAARTMKLDDLAQRTARDTTELFELSGRVANEATQGGQAADLALSTMAEISTEARRINQILALIEDIAFQTKILSLNAAVEAAHAGEQGKGFAVVATEVKTLANRSSEAAREIARSLGSTMEKIREGDALVANAVHRMHDIVERVNQISAKLESISQSAREQGEVVQSIHQSMRNLDDSSHQNASLVEQISATSQSMNQSAADLQAALSRFKLDDGATAGVMSVTRDIVVHEPHRSRA